MASLQAEAVAAQRVVRTVSLLSPAEWDGRARALGVACLLAGIWLACLLAQLPAFWGRLRRDVYRHLIALLLLGLVFALPPALAGVIWYGHEIPPPSAMVLLLTNPVTGGLVAFDPVAPLHGSPLAARLDGFLPLAVYPLVCSLAAALLALDQMLKGAA